MLATMTAGVHYTYEQQAFRVVKSDASIQSSLQMCHLANRVNTNFCASLCNWCLDHLKMSRKVFVCSCVVAVCAFSVWQSNLIRDTMVERGASPFVTVVDGVMGGVLSFTDVERKRIYVDAGQLRTQPNTLSNVITHEIAHSKGGMHGDGTFGMDYHANARIDGTIIEDDDLLVDNNAGYGAGGGR